MRRAGSAGLLSSAFVLLLSTCGAIEFSRWHHYSLNTRPNPSIGRGRSASADQILRRPTWDNGMRFRAAKPDAKHPFPGIEDDVDMKALEKKKNDVIADAVKAENAQAKAQQDESIKAKAKEAAASEDTEDEETLAAVGQGCDDGKDCKTGKCEGKVCKADPTKSPLGHTCGADSDCQTGICGDSSECELAPEQAEALADAEPENAEEEKAVQAAKAQVARQQSQAPEAPVGAPGSPEGEAQSIAAIKAQLGVAPPPGAATAPDSVRPADFSPQKIQAIELELSKAFTGMMSGVVAKIMTQKPELIRLAKKKKKKKMRVLEL